jgi:hypothetical protein
MYITVAIKLLHSYLSPSPLSITAAVVAAGRLPCSLVYMMFRLDLFKEARRLICNKKSLRSVLVI